MAFEMATGGESCPASRWQVMEPGKVLLHPSPLPSHSGARAAWPFEGHQPALPGQHPVLPLIGEKKNAAKRQRPSGSPGQKDCRDWN